MNYRIRDFMCHIQKYMNNFWQERPVLLQYEPKHSIQQNVRHFFFIPKQSLFIVAHSYEQNGFKTPRKLDYSGLNGLKSYHFMSSSMSLTFPYFEQHQRIISHINLKFCGSAPFYHTNKFLKFDVDRSNSFQMTNVDISYTFSETPCT